MDLSSFHRCRPHIFRSANRLEGGETQASFFFLFARDLIWFHKVLCTEGWVGSHQPHSTLWITAAEVQPVSPTMTIGVGHGQRLSAWIYAHNWMISILNNTLLTKHVHHPLETKK